MESPFTYHIYCSEIQRVIVWYTEQNLFLWVLNWEQFTVISNSLKHPCCSPLSSPCSINDSWALLVIAKHGFIMDLSRIALFYMFTKTQLNAVSKSWKFMRYYLKTGIWNNEKKPEPKRLSSNALYFKRSFMLLRGGCRSIRLMLLLQTRALEPIMWTSYLVLHLSLLWLCGEADKSMSPFERFAHVVHSCAGDTLSSEREEPAAEKCYSCTTSLEN